MQQRIVCAANAYLGFPFMLGIRHYDVHMCNAIVAFKASCNITEAQWRAAKEAGTQGFLDNRGNFLSRTEAWKVAEAAGQILRRVGGDDKDGGTLYSENLY
jgi:hypothetical protein